MQQYSTIQPFVQKDAKKIAQQLIDDLQKDGQYSVTDIPYHTHNGTDSPFIDPANFSNLNFFNNTSTFITGSILTSDANPGQALLGTFAKEPSGAFVNASVSAMRLGIAGNSSLLHRGNFIRNASIRYQVPFNSATDDESVWYQIQDAYTMRDRDWDVDFISYSFEDANTNPSADVVNIYLRVWGESGMNIKWNYAVNLITVEN